jgi:hypothetical protein
MAEPKKSIVASICVALWRHTDALKFAPSCPVAEQVGRGPVLHAPQYATTERRAGYPLTCTPFRRLQRTTRQSSDPHRLALA